MIPLWIEALSVNFGIDGTVVHPLLSHIYFLNPTASFTLHLLNACDFLPPMGGAVSKVTALMVMICLMYFLSSTSNTY